MQKAMKNSSLAAPQDDVRLQKLVFRDHALRSVHSLPILFDTLYRSSPAYVGRRRKPKRLEKLKVRLRNPLPLFELGPATQ